ncbi:MAG: FAD-dependent oxidoreductase [Deltaproteobacteria bacterium]|nr:FAD-dependent oxidoreductase [Deltaproteobacteria bacterium]
MSAPFIDEPARRTRVHAETDVLVVGGGTAGAAAAIAAARAGAATLLVERYGALGGIATGGLVILLLTLDDGAGRQMVRGLCQEITDRLAARGAAFFPPPGEWGSDDAAAIEHYRRWGLVWGSGPHRVRYSVAYDPEDLRLVLNEMVTGAGVRLLFHAWGCEPVLEGDGITAVTFHGKQGRFAIRAKVVIDATGDGDLFAAAGCAFELERVLPWLWFRMGGVENAAHAIETGGWYFHTIGDGRVLLPWGATERIGRKIDATDPEDLTFAELECRRQVMAEVDRLRAEVPEFRHAHLCDVASQLGITESRRLQGTYVLRREDVDRSFDDAIAVTGHWTKYGVRYAIPYRALRSPRVRNLLVAGRCISVDHRVHHATKEIPPCMATGEAAGTAAALAVDHGVTPAAVDVSELRARLRQAGAE